MGGRSSKSSLSPRISSTSPAPAPGLPSHITPTPALPPFHPSPLIKTTTPHVISLTNAQSSTRDSMSQGVRSNSDRVTSVNIQSSLFHSDDDSNDVDDPLSTSSTSRHLDDTLPHLHSDHQSRIIRANRRSSSFANCQNCNAVCIPRVICNAKHVYCGGDCYWSYTIRHESDQPHPVPRHNNTFADATPLSQALHTAEHVDVQDRWASRPEAVVTQPMDVSAAPTLVDKANMSTSSSASSLRIHPSQRSHRRLPSRNTISTLAPIHSPVNGSPSPIDMSSVSSHSHNPSLPIVHDDDTPEHSSNEDDVSMLDHSREPTQTSTSTHDHTPEHDLHIDTQDDDEGYDAFEQNVIPTTTTTRHPKKPHVRHSISYQPLHPHQQPQHQRRHSDLVNSSSSRPILIPTPPVKLQPSPYLYVRT